MSVGLQQMHRALRSYDRGLSSDAELGDEMIRSAFDMVDAGDPELADAVPVMLVQGRLDPDRLGTLGALVLRAIRDDVRTPFPMPSPFAGLKDLVVAHTRRLFDDDPALGAQVVARLPRELCTLELLGLALDAPMTRRTHRWADRALFDTAVHVAGPVRAFRALVAPRLPESDTDSVDLLIAAYLNRGLQPKDRLTARVRLRETAAHGSTPLLLRLAERLSIESWDEDASRVAVILSHRDDLAAADAAIVATVLWLAGDRETAHGIARSADIRVEWGTAGRWSLVCALRAESLPPQAVLDLLAAGPHAQNPGQGIATVGAMVARLALIRMRAHLALGDEQSATREALGVVRYHGYRGYDLHTQGAGYEFDAEFASRLAATPDELFRAGEFVTRLGLDPATDAPLLYEGSLLPRSQRS